MRRTYCSRCRVVTDDDTRFKCHCDDGGHVEEPGIWVVGTLLEELVKMSVSVDA